MNRATGATGALQALAGAVAADTSRWWGFALSWHHGQWLATVVPSPAAFTSSTKGARTELEELEDVVGPTLMQAISFIAEAVGSPVPRQEVVDPDLQALVQMMAAEAVTGLVVAYDAVVDDVVGEQWEVYRSGRGGRLHADGATFAEVLQILGR